MVTVGQLMKKDLVTVDSGTSVIEAAKLMKTCNVGSVLIYQDNRVIGMVTESDIVKKVVGSDRSPYFIPVEDIMSSPLVGIEERRPLTEAADLMNRHQRTTWVSSREGLWWASSLCGSCSVLSPSTSSREW